MMPSSFKPGFFHFMLPFLAAPLLILAEPNSLLADGNADAPPAASAGQARLAEAAFKPDDTSDYVSLYYFDDIARLMQVLRPDSRLVGGNAQFITDAAAQSQTLIADDLAVSTARQHVNDARRILAIKQSALQESKRRLNDAKLQAQTATARQTSTTEQSATNLRSKLNEQNTLQAKIDNETNRVTDETAAVSQAQSDFQAAKSELATDPQNSDKKKAVTITERVLQAATNKLKKDNSTLGADKERMITLNAEVVVAQRNDAALQQDAGKPVVDATAAVSQAQGEVTTAAGDVTAAEGTDHTAEIALDTDRNVAVAQAFVENHAFALSRDNQPFWYAPHDPLSTDPLQEVALAGFPDSKRILIRGSQTNIEAVKTLISSFDRPQAQALMTLFTIEISSKANKKGAEDTSQALRMLQDKLAVTSQLMNESMDDIRRGVLLAVEAAKTDALHDTRFSATGKPLTPEEIRYEFYDQPVRAAFGIADPDIQQKILDYLPDPTRVTTPAEALVALSLAGDKYEQIAAFHILSSLDYTRRVGFSQLKTGPSTSPTTMVDLENGQGKDLGRPDPLESWRDKTLNQTMEKSLGSHFSRLHWWLGRGGQRGAGAYNFQKELIFELQTTIPRKLLADMEEEFKNYAQLRKLIAKKTVGRTMTAALENRRIASEELLTKYYEAITKLPGNPPGTQRATLLDHLISQDNTPENLAGIQTEIDARTTGVAAPNSSIPKALAREAAINETLKQALKTINDDLDVEFVEPMFDLFRSQIASNSGVAVGIVQRTSILASNRFVARVSPNAAADLEMGNQKNVLADLTDLVNLIGQVGAAGTAAAGRTLAAGAMGVAGGALSAIPVETPFQSPKSRNNPIAVSQTSQALEALDRLPNRTTPPGVYGLTTGNTFEVTPVVDPSGQAMQFKFDHVLSSHITEPDGTTNTLLPRIERHSMNTEVQLTNNEIRMISQFDSNAKLGVPTKYLGGIPIIREFFPRVPILGYFIKQSGEAAEVQQSLVLAQATMFPTIGDVIGLLTEQN